MEECGEQYLITFERYQRLVSENSLYRAELAEARAENERLRKELTEARVELSGADAALEVLDELMHGEEKGLE